MPPALILFFFFVGGSGAVSSFTYGHRAGPIVPGTGSRT